MKKTMQQIQESLAKLQDKQNNSYRQGDSKGYSQFQANTPWKQNGYQRFHNRATFRPRGGFWPNRYQNGGHNFSNQFRLRFYDYTRRQNKDIEYEDLKAALINRFDD